MTEQNSGHKNFNEESPIPIPPVDQAWQSMQQKLDMELPVVGNLPARSPMRYIWIKAVLMATTVATITAALWLYNHKHPQNASSFENIVSDTNLVVTSSDIQADSHLSDVTARDSSSSAINSKSDIDNNKPLPASSFSSQSLPSPLPSAKSPVPLQRSVINKIHPVQKNTGQSIAAQHTTNQQTAGSIASGKQYPVAKTGSLPAAVQQITDQQSLSSPASDKPTPVEKENVPTQQATDRQLPGKFNTYKSDRSAAETTERHPLQLALIQMPIAKYNTGLLHKADMLALRQISSKGREKKWALYIQLNIPIPLYGDSSYFMGPNGKDQFYRNLIPALRVERKLWKGALSLDILPAVSANVTSSVPKKDSGITWFPHDTTRTILKQYGWGLALQYQFLIHNKWQLGAGIQTSFLQKAALLQNISDTLGFGSSGNYPASPSDKQGLSAVRINGMAELNYVAGKWQLGIRTLVPITRVSKTKDISAKPLNMEFVIRRRLWTK